VLTKASGRWAAPVEDEDGGTGPAGLVEAGLTAAGGARRDEADRNSGADPKRCDPDSI
jgi:hypothetical protein